MRIKILIRFPFFFFNFPVKIRHSLTVRVSSFAKFLCIRKISSNCNIFMRCVIILSLFLPQYWYASHTHTNCLNCLFHIILHYIRIDCMLLLLVRSFFFFSNIYASDHTCVCVCVCFWETVEHLNAKKNKCIVKPKKKVNWFTGFFAYCLKNNYLRTIRVSYFRLWMCVVVHVFFFSFLSFN